MRTGVLGAIYKENGCMSSLANMLSNSSCALLNTYIHTHLHMYSHTCAHARTHTRTYQSLTSQAQTHTHKHKHTQTDRENCFTEKK